MRLPALPGYFNFEQPDGRACIFIAATDAGGSYDAEQIPHR